MLSNNIIRKSVSTFVREVDISKKQVVADSILHSEKTTDIHYATQNLQIAAAKGSQLVRGVFNQSSAASGVSPAASSLIGNSPKKIGLLRKRIYVRKTFQLCQLQNLTLTKKNMTLQHALMLAQSKYMTK